MKKWKFVGIGMIIMTLLVFIFYQIGMTSYITETVWRDWRGKASNDGYYLAKELLKHHKNQINSTRDFPTSAQLQRHQVLFIIPNGVETHATAQQIKALKHWIETGGVLVISPQTSVAKKLGIRIKNIDKNGKSDDHEIVWQGTEKTFTLDDLFHNCQGIQFAQGKSTGAAKNLIDCEIIHRFQFGQGEIITPITWKLWQDGEKIRGERASEEDIPILQKDHAAFLAYLIGERKNILWLKERLHLSTRWLIPIVMALLLFLVIIWRFGSRFGVLLTLKRPQTANLQRHLQAAGDLLSSVGAENALLDASRERLRAELPHDYQILLTNRERLTAALEKDFALAPSLVGEALYRKDGRFIYKMRAIEKVRLTIGRSR